jgi:hypothetical protein
MGLQARIVLRRSLYTIKRPSIPESLSIVAHWPSSGEQFHFFPPQLQIFSSLCRLHIQDGGEER